MCIIKKLYRLAISTLRGHKEATTRVSDLSKELPSEIDYDKLPPMKVTKSVTGNYNMLLMDDFIEQFTLYELDIIKINREFNYDVRYDFDVYEAIGPHAGFMTKKFIDEIDSLHLAVLDLTLETSIKLSNGDIIEFDGVDIAGLIKDKFPDCVILFCTAHSNNIREPLMKTYIDKFNSTIGGNFDELYMSKADCRHRILWDKISSIIKK